ncbi:reticulon-2a [Aplochiton taeniatus]
MGQVLGFSHCQDYGSVSSTPDSTTPPCTDGGNEESELYDLQTAREWSDDDDDDCGLLRDDDDDEGLASSSSLWGTPRQTSQELTFSYIAIAEPEAVGASRHLRDAAGRRRGATAAAPPRGSLAPMIPAAPSPFSVPESLVAVETTPAELLSAARPVGGLKGDTSSSSSASIGQNTQEQLVSEQWFSALNLSEDHTLFTHIAVMDLIYWKDMERTGMVFTGLVVGLLSLFQLSLVTVLSTISLAVMCFTISVRIYYKVLHVLNCGDGVHPFKAYLDLDVSLSGEQADHYMQKAVVMVVSAVNTLKRLLFVSNLFDSLKLLVLVYLVTYFGDMCNGLTLLIIGVISLFSVPLFYQQRQAEVDGFFAKIQASIDNIKDILHRIVQGGGPPADTTPGGAKPKDH